MPAAWHNANACTNRCPNADRCRLRNRAIERWSGAVPAASHRHATTSTQAASSLREDRTPVVYPYNRIRTISRGSYGGAPRSSV